MLYALLSAVVLGVAYSSNNTCDYSSASECLSQGFCSWYVDSQSSCGHCEFHENCQEDAMYDCHLKCNINNVPTWANDSCSNRDNITCGALECNATWTACLENTNCSELSKATATYEKHYAALAGCDYNDEKCKDNNQVFLKALNDSLREYCWGQNNTVACSLYESAVSCVANNCSQCDDCGRQCQTYMVSCMFDEDCIVALDWLSIEVDSFSNSTDLFFPYELEADKNEYCNASETSKYCNSKFDLLWNCLSNDCLHQRCLYTTCNAQAQKCYQDQGCQDQLSSLLEKYPILTDLTPGIFQSLANYYCSTDMELNCDNANFTALLNCYGSQCCWDTDVCTENNGLEDCTNPDCLKEACVEVHCLPAVQDCFQDEEGCGNAIVAQGNWNHYCTQCVNNTNSTYCNQSPPVNCSALNNSSAILYIQKYCWEHTCSPKLTNLMHCALTSCSDCNLTSLAKLAGNSSVLNLVTTNSLTTNAPVGDSPVTTSILNKIDPCTCLFSTCWNALSQCFFDQTCWDLYFSDKKGYGFQSIIESIFTTPMDNIIIMPSYADSQVRNNYCSDKDCNDKFWNVWSCVLSPIYLGDDYYPGCEDKDYFNNKISGCSIAEFAYTQLYPECMTKKCLGFANDCAADLSSPCFQTWNASIDDREWSSCMCKECTTNCTDDSDTFKSNYLRRCGNDGSSCAVEYDNLANCVYQECADGTGTLPGSKSTACNTSSASMHSGIIALIFSMLLFWSL